MALVCQWFTLVCQWFTENPQQSNNPYEQDIGDSEKDKL